MKIVSSLDAFTDTLELNIKLKSGSKPSLSLSLLHILVVVANGAILDYAGGLWLAGLLVCWPPVQSHLRFTRWDHVWAEASHQQWGIIETVQSPNMINATNILSHTIISSQSLGNTHVTYSMIKKNDALYCTIKIEKQYKYIWDILCQFNLLLVIAQTKTM